MSNSCLIIDTGCANLSSVKFAVERLGFNAFISDKENEITSADKVILPGVGSAEHAMKTLHQKGLVAVIQQLEQPVLGFCLGMQLMTQQSTESANATPIECLNLIATEIKPLIAPNLRLPHMGWNTLTSIEDHPLFYGVPNQSYVYFVHSYAAPISEFTLATTEYGQAFSAAIAYKNFMGCQFHPERSSDTGSRIIRNFLTEKFTE
jgi:glutamine amidotransferase